MIRTIPAFFALLVVVLVFTGKVFAQTPPPEFIPNDPRHDDVWARQLNLLKAWAWEQTATPLEQQGVIALLDDWVDCTHPDLKDNCLPQFTFNATDRPYQSKGLHGIGAASLAGARTHNSIGVSSIAGLTGRVKFISVKVVDNTTTRSEWVIAGLHRVLQLKRSGLNIVAVSCNVVTGIPIAREAEVDRLLKDLAAEHVYIIAPAGNSPVNLDTVTAFPAAYSRRYKNIITAAAVDEDGETLAAFSGYGPESVSVAAKANVKVVSTLDPIDDSGGFGGTSSVTPQVAAAYALIRLYKEQDGEKAAERLKFTARMFPALEKKIGFGRIDVYDSLTMQIGCPSASLGPILITERGSNRAVALTSVSHKSEFSKTDPHNISADQQTRLMLFAYNVDVNSPVVVQAQDSQGQTFQLPVESVGKLTRPACIMQINVKLRSELAIGDVGLTVEVQSRISNRAVITIK